MARMKPPARPPQHPVGAKPNAVEVEIIKFGKTDSALLQSLVEQHNARMSQAITGIAEDKGIKEEDGWRVDLKLGAFVRPRPAVKPPTAPPVTQ